MILFSAVDHDDCLAAYNWHRGFAGANDALYPRDHDSFQSLVIEGSVWAAREPGGDFLALCYASYDEVSHECEIGGLMVATHARGKGLGAAIMRLTLAHMLLEENILSRPGVRVISHVLKSNEQPRGIIEKQLLFKHSKEVSYPSADLPGLRADEDNMVRGDEFELSIPESILALAEWARSWNGSIGKDSVADVDFRPGVSMTDWSQALESIAASFSA